MDALKVRLENAKRALSLSSSQVAETTRSLRSLTQDLQTMNRELQELKERKKRIAETLKNKEKERDKYYGCMPNSQYIDAARRGGLVGLTGRQAQNALQDRDHAIHDYAADYLGENDPYLRSLNDKIEIAEDTYILQSEVDEKERKIREKEQEKLRLENSLRTLQGPVQLHQNEIDNRNQEIKQMEDQKKNEEKEKKRMEEN